MSYPVLYICLGLLVVVRGQEEGSGREPPHSEHEDWDHWDPLHYEDSTNKTIPLPKPQNLAYFKVTSRQMVLSWSLDMDPHMDIDGVRVFYTFHGFTGVITSEGTRTALLIKGLEPYTTYNISVKAFKVDLGEGQKSDMISVTTDTDHPSAPRITNLSCFQPIDPTMRHQQIFVEWKRPDVFYKTIDSYFIYNKMEGISGYEYHQLQANQGDDNKFFLKKAHGGWLEAQHKYTVKICAGTRSIIKQNQVFQGNFSNENSVFLPATGCNIQNELEDGMETSGPGVLVGVTVVLIMLGFLLAILTFVLWKRYFNAMYYYIHDTGNGDEEDDVRMNEDYEEL